MEFLSYLLTAVIAYLGVMGGYALALISPEELKPGKKYFEALHMICFILVMLLLMYFRSPTWGAISLMAVGVFIKVGRGRAAQKIAYGILGAMFAVMAQVPILFKITASLIFIFSLASGTLCVMRHKEKSRVWQLFYILGSNALFFLTALPLYFLDLKIVG